MSDENKLTRESAAALVDLVRAVRPAWDARATLAALAEVRDRGDVAYVAYRVLKAALTPEAATPRALTFDAVWAEPDAMRKPTLTPPRMNPNEFTPTNPVPSTEAIERIKRLRAIVRDNPHPAPIETKATRPRETKEDRMSDYQTPPPGWFPFGTHLDHPGPMEFSDAVDDGLMPLWERPLTPTGSPVRPQDGPTAPNPTRPPGSTPQARTTPHSATTEGA